MNYSTLQRQQNKILLQLRLTIDSNERRTHWCCPKCGIIYKVDCYTDFAKFIFKDDFYRNLKIYNHIYSVRNYLPPLSKLNCLFCENFVYHLLYDFFYAYWNCSSTAQIHIDTRIYTSLKYLFDCLPENIYTLFINDHTFSSFQPNWAAISLRDMNTQYTLQILNEISRPIHTLLFTRN